MGPAIPSAQGLFAQADQLAALPKELQSRADTLEGGNPGVARAEVCGDTVGDGVEGDGVQAREAGSVGEDVLDEAPPVVIPAGAEYEPLRQYINTMEWPDDNEALVAMEDDVEGFGEQAGWPGAVDRERWRTRDAALECAQGLIDFMATNPESFRNMKGGLGGSTVFLMELMRAVQSTVNPAGSGQARLEALWN